MPSRSAIYPARPEKNSRLISAPGNAQLSPTDPDGQHTTATVHLPPRRPQRNHRKNPGPRRPAPARPTGGTPFSSTHGSSAKRCMIPKSAIRRRIAIAGRLRTVINAGRPFTIK
jgi:hypothetical protein